jgi:hypothetical protein
MGFSTSPPQAASTPSQTRRIERSAGTIQQNRKNFNTNAQRHSAAARNPMFTTKDTKDTKKNRTIWHIQYFVSFVLFVVKKFCQK